ncbi:MAG: hypothetical protein V2A79_02340 [Planctomycetota bacterium]
MLSDAIAEKTLLVNPGGIAAQVYNIFGFSRFVEIHAIYGEFIDVTNVAVATLCGWELWDGTNRVPITALAGVDCSTAALNSMILDAGLAGATAVFLNSTQARINKMAEYPQTNGSMILAKNGVSNWIRFCVTTAVATNFTVRFRVLWNPRSAGTVWPV